MKVSRFLLVAIVVALAVSGCATGSNKVSTYGFTQPEQATSVSHPVEMEKAGDKYVTIFPAILDAGVWGSESLNGAGVWPVLAEQKGSKLLVGYAFVTDLNWWGDYLLQVVMVGRVENLINSKIVYLNRDGGWVYDLTGREFNYDSKKFDEDPSYQTETFNQGTTFVELQNFWKIYSEKRGVDPNVEIFQEIRVGSPEWEGFKTQLASRLGNNYTMADGEVRQGYLPLKDFRKESAKNNGTTAGQCFMRSAFIPVAIDPISAGIGVASSILNGLIAANNGPITGFYARAECLRGDLKPNFRLMQYMYKQLLLQRDAVIYQLQKKAPEAPRREK